MVETICKTDFKSETSLKIESLPSMVNVDSVQNVQSNHATSLPDMAVGTVQNIKGESAASSSIHSLDSLQVDDTREMSTEFQCDKPDEAVCVSSIKPIY